MSAGERSCKHYGDYEIHKDMPLDYICNVDCEKYEWDGKTKPDSVSKED